MLILGAIVFLYRQGFAFPDLATSFGELTAAYDAQIYHTPLGDFSAHGEAERFESAAGYTPQIYATSSNMQTPQPERSYPGN